MIKEIKMPNLGTTVDEMKIVGWLKKAGDRVERGEALLEVETDKATMEVESYAAGYLKKIMVQPGDTVVTGSIVAYIGEENDVFNGPAAENKEQVTAKSEKAVEVKHEAAQVKISPMVRKLAEKFNVDVTKVKGSGPDGLILKEDIMNAVNTGESKGETKAEPNASNEGANNLSGAAANDFVPFSRIGTAIANAMTKSKSEIPHVYFSTEIDASAMIKLRSASGKKVSYNAMIIGTAAKCLEKFPYLAAKYNEKGRTMPKDMNIGLAAAKGDDLFVPVIKKAGNLSMSGIESEIKRLVDSVNSGSIKQEDISGGVFTVSNLGAYGLSSFTAVINPPEAAILAVGGMLEKPVAINGGIHVRTMINITLSVDHRVANGAYAAAFLRDLKQSLENISN